MTPDRFAQLMVWGLTGIVIAICLLFATLGFVAGRAMAHSWYDPACCSSQDCTEYKGEVTAGRGAWLLDDGRSVPYGDKRIRISADKDFHVCERKDRSIICLYVPDNGV